MDHMVIEEEAARSSGFGHHNVTIVPNYMVTVADGTRLAMKVWYPGSMSDLGDICFEGSRNCYSVYRTLDGEKSYEFPFPVIMEYIPYRKSDFTAQGDFQYHTWFASHGYVVVRVDMRGSGDSEGLLCDEYLELEQQDGCDVIDWLSKQPWCNGNVGMFGKSWGGFNGVQVAFKQPPALKAVVTVYFTDDRYNDDVHYVGGCVVGMNGAFSWSSFMFSMNALPPNPVTSDDWREKWMERLEKTSNPWGTIWLSHQLKDDYWKQGSVCEDYSKIKIPVLSVGGYSDGYTNPAFRFAQNVDSAKALIGPWGHDWPDIATPGPNIAYLDECLRWWDCHLKGIRNTANDIPKYRVYIQDSCPPNPALKVWPGHWIALNDTQETCVESFYLNNKDMMLLRGEPYGDQQPRSVQHLDYLAVATGIPPWYGLGAGPDLPMDQSISDSTGLIWDTDPLTEDLAFVGFPKLDVTISIANGRRGLIAVRLCDVNPSTGESTLITVGVLNLTHRDGHDEDSVKDLDEGQKYNVTVTCNGIGYRVRRGNILRTSILPSYWPYVWPSASKENQLIIHSGVLRLPLFKGNVEGFQKDHPGFDTLLGTPRIGVNLPTEQREPSGLGRKIEFDIVKGTTRVTSDTRGGRVMLLDTGTLMEHHQVDTYLIKQGDPLSASSQSNLEMTLDWPAHDIRTKVVTESLMTLDETNFYLTNEVTAQLNDQTIFQRKWSDVIERKYV